MGSYEIDLRTQNAVAQKTNYRYDGGVVMPEYTSGGALEYMMSESLVNSTKSYFFHYHCGFQTVGSGYTAKDNDDNYFVYKIEGII